MTSLEKKESPLKNHVGSILGTLFLEMLFLLIVLLVGFIAYSYIVASKTVFSALAVIQYGSGWESFWLVIFFWSDLIFFIIVMLCFLELVLWLGRTAVKTVLKTQEKIANAGAALLILFVIFVIYSDVMKFGIADKTIKLFKH